MQANAVGMIVLHQPLDSQYSVIHLYTGRFPIGDGGDAAIGLLSIAFTIKDLHQSLLPGGELLTPFLEALFLSFQGIDVRADIDDKLCQILQNGGTLHLKS